MSDERWRQISRLYHEAVALAPEARAVFLRTACTNDAGLLAELESLLSNDSRVERLLEPQEARGPLVGCRIGSYDVRLLLGSGGMGEVYRARDEKLGRDVAIKVLAPAFVEDREYISRIESEARLLASLSHPGIAGIYGLETAWDTPALVMELVEGETLSERLARGPMSLREILAIAPQIAEALEAAHEVGIVHRDLKPSNIKITPQGVVKILDFGLAKLVKPQAADRGEGTPAGRITGTPAYMSPEQARGMQADRRSDVWAFGCVLFEMLTAEPLFKAPSLAETLAAVLDRPIDWQRLPPGRRADLERLLRRCVERDVKNRLQHIGDARLELKELTGLDDGGGKTPINVEIRRLGPSVGLVVGIVAMGMLIAWAIANRSVPAAPTGAIRFSIETPPPFLAHSMAVSPDGRSIAFTASPSFNEAPLLFIRRLDSDQFQAMAGTVNGVLPFWSPDNRAVGFYDSEERRLKAVDIGGQPRAIAETPHTNFEGASWTVDNTIVFSSGAAIYRVPASGGTPELAAKQGPSDPGNPTIAFRWPQILPDGRRYLYQGACSEPVQRAIVVRSLASPQVSCLMTAGSRAAFARPHFVLFTRSRVLMAQQMDLSTLRLVGNPVSIADDINVSANAAAAFAVSDGGTLVYRTADAKVRSLVWVDRVGKVSAPVGALSTDAQITLSADGRRVTFSESRGDALGEDVYVHDLTRDVTDQLTRHPNRDHNAIWSPDDSRVAFDGHRDGTQFLYAMRADGTGKEQALYASKPGEQIDVMAWGREFIVFARAKSLTEEASPELVALPLVGEQQPFVYLSRVARGRAALSPDGRWLAYVADAGGMKQVVVQSFPDPALNRYQISASGGVNPVWSRDGRELFYIDGDRRMVAVSVSTQGAFAVKSSADLFAAPTLVYDVAPDGRFLFSVPSASAGAGRIHVILNWTTIMENSSRQGK